MTVSVIIVRGMDTKHPVQEIIERWPSRRALCDDINAGLPEGRRIDLVAVHRWHQRKSIPGQYDGLILASASMREIPLEWRELMDARSVHNDQDGHAAEKCNPTTAKEPRNYPKGVDA